MREAIRRAVKGLFPELGAGLHLDRYARVLAVADAPGQGAASERFRPRYAVDIQILTADGEPDPAFPTIRRSPSCADRGGAGESAFFSFPEPGAQVVVGFATEGRIIRSSGKPIPRRVASRGGAGRTALAEHPRRLPAGGRWRQLDAATEAKIEDASWERVVGPETSADELGKETRTIREHSKESVGGIKQVEATTLSLVGGLRADLGSLGNVNMTAGAPRPSQRARPARTTTGGDFAEDVGGNRTARLAGNAGDEVAGARKPEDRRRRNLGTISPERARRR